MLKLELPYLGVVRNRVWIVTFAGLLGLSYALGFADGNGTTTEHSIASISNQAGVLQKKLVVVTTTQIDADRPTSKLPVPPGSFTKLQQSPTEAPAPRVSPFVTGLPITGLIAQKPAPRTP